MSERDVIDDLTAELFAADVVQNLGVIAKAQHRIAIALSSPCRLSVIEHLRGLGITEAAATSYMNQPLPRAEMLRIADLLAEIRGWRAELMSKLRALAVAEKYPIKKED